MEKLPKIFLISIAVMVILGNFQTPEAEKLFQPEEYISGLLTLENNSLLPSSPLPEPKVTGRVRVVVTAYSSTVWETYGDPFETASGTRVKDGIIANNLLPFGTKVRLPEIYGEKVFVVEDRMNSRKGSYHFDIWFPSYWEAKNFGTQNTYIEILES